MWRDVGYFKRAQIVPSDLALAGVADVRDLHELTIFADNLVPHVLRCEGVLVYAAPLAAHVDAGKALPPGPWEREIRACAVHACALLAPRPRAQRARARPRPVEPRAGAGVQGAPAASLPDGVLLRCREPCAGGVRGGEAVPRPAPWGCATSAVRARVNVAHVFHAVAAQEAAGAPAVGTDGTPGGGAVRPPCRPARHGKGDLVGLFAHTAVLPTTSPGHSPPRTFRRLPSPLPRQERRARRSGRPAGSGRPLGAPVESGHARNFPSLAAPSGEVLRAGGAQAAQSSPGAQARSQVPGRRRRAGATRAGRDERRPRHPPAGFCPRTLRS
jgi:hypothetical protein